MIQRHRDRNDFWNAIAGLQIYARLHGIRVMPISFYRTATEQRSHFGRGKSMCDGYVKISKHQKWEAMDLAVLDENDNIKWDGPEYELLGRRWTRLRHTWGGNFKSLRDVGHFER